MESLPVETKIDIVVNLDYPDIILWCQINKETAVLCQEPSFWQSLIRSRYPQVILDKLYKSNPRKLFYITNQMYEVIISPREHYDLHHYFPNYHQVLGAFYAGRILYRKAFGMKTYRDGKEILFSRNWSTISSGYADEQSLKELIEKYGPVIVDVSYLGSNGHQIMHKYIDDLPDDILIGMKVVLTYYMEHVSIEKIFLEDNLVIREEL